MRKPGFVYEFHWRKGNSYRCEGCRRVGKPRCVKKTIVNDIVVTSDKTRQLDRGMRSDVRSTGKRPRDAYTDMLTTFPKRLKETEFQTEVVVNLPSYNEDL